MAQHQYSLMLRHKYIILPKKHGIKSPISFLFIIFASFYILLEHHIVSNRAKTRRESKVITNKET